MKRRLAIWAKQYLYNARRYQNIACNIQLLGFIYWIILDGTLVRGTDFKQEDKGIIDARIGRKNSA
jgi:hypothetical protein